MSRDFSRFSIADFFFYIFCVNKYLSLNIFSKLFFSRTKCEKNSSKRKFLHNFWVHFDATNTSQIKMSKIGGDLAKQMSGVVKVENFNVETQTGA